MLKTFFQHLQLEPSHVAFEDTVPELSTATWVRQRAVYKDLIHQWPHFLTAAVRDTVESWFASVSAAGLGRPLGN